MNGLEKELVIKNYNGLHGRPSKDILNEAIKYRSEIILITEDGKQVNAKSLVSILAADIKENQKVFLRATGDDAELAVRRLSKLIETVLPAIHINSKHI